MRSRAQHWLIGGLLLSGCNVQPPGELVGEYAVRGSLLENTCGSAALPAADPLDFQVQIRDDGISALWLLTPPARPGTLDDDGDFEFETESSFVVDPERGAQAPDPFTTDPEAFVDEASLEQAFDPAAAGVRPRCVLTIVERMRGTLTRNVDGPIVDAADAVDDADSTHDVRATDDGTDDDGAASADLSGDNEIEIRATAGSDCTLVMQDAGGPFEALPCFAHYAIEGELIEP